MKPNPKLISLRTTDGTKLEGLLFSETKKQKIVVVIHGACMNFLEGTSYFIPEMTESYKNYDFLSVNMRAHDIGYIVNRYDQKEGWAWQTIEKNRFDLDAIYSYLLDEGYSNVILCGHSWGGLICADYLSRSPNIKCSGMILLSPTVSFKLLAEVNYRSAVVQTFEQAEIMISQGIGDSIIPTSTKSPIPFMSARTAHEFLSSDFEMRDFLEKTNIDVDIIVGGLEHKKLQDFSTAISDKNKSVHSHIISKSNHFYADHERELVDLIDSILGR